MLFVAWIIVETIVIEVHTVLQFGNIRQSAIVNVDITSYHLVIYWSNCEWYLSAISSPLVVIIIVISNQLPKYCIHISMVGFDANKVVIINIAII